MIRLLSSGLECHRNLERGKENDDLLKYISPNRDPLLFQKNPCHLVALVKDTAIFNVSLYPLLTRDEFVCVIITHLILLYLVSKLNNKVFLKQAKPFAEFTLLFAT